MTLKWVNSTGDATKGFYVKTSQSVWKCEQERKFYVLEYIHCTDEGITNGISVFKVFEAR